MLSLVEVSLSDYAFSLRRIFFALEVESLLALLEARAARMNPKEASGYIDRAIMRARHEAQRQALEIYTLIR